MATEIPAPCRKLDPHRGAGQPRTGKGRQPRTGKFRPAPRIAWTDEALETFSIRWDSPNLPEEWRLYRSDPNDPTAGYVHVGSFEQFAEVGSDLGKPVGCYYIVGVDAKGKWVTGRSNVLCNWTSPHQTTEGKRFL